MRRNIRVAMIIQAYYPHVGGAERQLAALAPRLQARGVDVHILTRRYPGMKPFERVNDVPVHRLPVPGPKALASLAFTLSSLWLLRRLKPDVLHAHELLSPATTAVAAKRLFRIPVVAKVLRGGLLGDIAKLKSRKSGEQRIDWLKQYVDAFITISHEIDHELESIGVDASRRVFIPNGVDVGRFNPAGTDQKKAVRQRMGITGSPVAIFAGRLVKEKRVDRLLEVWPFVREQHPNAELLILGEGPERSQLEKMAGGGVRFTGNVEDVQPYLQAADVFILPSSTEGLSNSLLEAMAAGLACAVTPVGGAPDLIKHQVSGWLVQVEDTQALQEAITELFADKELRRRLGEEARRRVVQAYSLDQTAESLYHLYQEVLMRKEARLGEGLQRKAS